MAYRSRSSRVAFGIGVTFAAAAAACFSPQYPMGLACDAPGDCPPDQTCANAICVSCIDEEICNGVVDDDCDGKIDEGGCECVNDNRQPCGLDNCPPGDQVCVDGKWSDCEGGVPVTEVCDGVNDEDCDGAIDNMCPCVPVNTYHATGCGPCGDGEQWCSPGGLGACERASPRIDCCEGDTRACGQGTGECTTGVEMCNAAGAWTGVCSGVSPRPEACNALDDDCDGKIDESISACGLDVSCTDFSFPTAGTYTTTVPLPSGATKVPYVEIRGLNSNGEADGNWAYSYASGTFTFTTQMGSSNETVRGRACVLGIGTTTAAATAATGHVGNGLSQTISISPTPTTSYHRRLAVLGAVPSYWPTNDDDAEYTGSVSGSSMTLAVNGGNGGSWAEGRLVALSLPAGYDVSTVQAFTVSNGASRTLPAFTRAQGRASATFLSVTSYHTCEADFFSFNGDCTDNGTQTTCTVTASNGYPCSYVAGRALQITWDL